MKAEFNENEGRRRGERSHRKGAKTFRRGRAIAFMDILNVKRSTIKQQLQEPEYASIQPMLIGELKALDMVINEFVQLFEIQESELAAEGGHDDETSE